MYLPLSWRFQEEILGVISSIVTKYFNCEGKRTLKICEAYNGNKSGTASRVNASIDVLLCYFLRAENCPNRLYSKSILRLAKYLVLNHVELYTSLRVSRAKTNLSTALKTLKSFFFFTISKNLLE